jgi:UDP-glucose 4-epimerase
MSKILVTGGAGFIGSHIIDQLIDNGHEVVIIDNLSTGKKENINKKAKFIKIDIGDPKIKNIFKKEKFDYVFHLAAQIDVRKSVEDPIADAKTNILGSLNILENCKNFSVKKVIFSSTGGAIYGDAEIIPTPETYPEKPISPYGICKLSVEKYLYYYHQIFGLNYIALRYGNVYGPWQNSKGEAGVVAIFLDKILSGKQPVINGDGKQARDYVYVDDVVRANMLALESEEIGTYNVGTGIETDVNKLFSVLNNNFSNKIKEVHGEAKMGEQARSCLSFELIKKDLGWEPEVGLEEGIGKTVLWFKNSRV